MSKFFQPSHHNKDFHQTQGLMISGFVSQIRLSLFGREGQQGVSLYLSIMIMSILLAIVLGISGILLGQLKIMKGIENSVIAFYAADTGIEEVLNGLYADFLGGSGIPPSSQYPITMSNWAFYDVEVVCCTEGGDCLWNVTTSCPLPQIDPNCPGSYYCIKSVGTYRETKRAIQITL